MNSKKFAYVGFGIALLAAVTGVFGWFPAEIVWGVAGIFGFGGYGALRSFVKSQGWKTYAVAGFPIIFGVLLLFNIIDIVIYQTLLGLAGTITGVTMTNGIDKAQA